MSHDAATDYRASYTPQMGCDSTADLVHEPFADYSGPFPSNRETWRKLTRELVEQGLSQAEVGEGTDARRVAIEMLKLFSRDDDRRFAIRAVLYGRLLRIESRSLAEIGADYGLTRASISHTYRQIKRLHPDLHNPADKPEDYCADAAMRRSGYEKKREKPKYRVIFP